MTKNMLIDATHTEETRVVVMDGNKLEEYDVETSSKKQLKGNIYLAKVIRVEPSLQAAFVEYGGNRHGFLAFSEIHPDYYQIPVADREKLLNLQAEDIRHIQDNDEEDSYFDIPSATNGEPVFHEHTEDGEENDGIANDSFETMGGENDPDEGRHTYQETIRFLKNYKIQEVIRRRQILLVQVVKEERGNKGAALTTYLSLAGRYCVLMPNALKGGGISRKITSLQDRKRLKDIMAEINVPNGMAMIIRTAGAQRSRTEIHKDCEYLLRLWDEIRDLTMQSIAPTLVYEEASLIKRAIRDIYSHDIHDIIIDGEDAWKAAREFMRVLMPQNTRKLRLWKEGSLPLFSHYKVEDHLNAMFSPTVQLKSGGYLVINQTEALVAIDVNSGRSIKERGIEETALRTNQEAASEIARQLKLRDLAGLIVIDFIDMDTRKHNIMVERRLKEALHHDRARIQVGHISHFGLLEMSRQRLRPSVAESSFIACPHCNGSGVIRGTESSALHILRLIEEEASKHPNHEINVHVAEVIAIYILNHKRTWLSEIERNYNMKLSFVCEAGLLPAQATFERVQALPKPYPSSIKADNVENLPYKGEQAAQIRTIPIQNSEASTDEEMMEGDEDQNKVEANGQDNEDYSHRRRRRRRRRTNGNISASETAHREDSGETISHEQDHIDEQPVAQARPQPMQQPQRTNNNNNRRRPYNDRYGRRQDNAQPQAQNNIPVYQGPTPANPFEPFDIFDVIEQVEAEHIPSPQEEAAPSRRNPQTQRAAGSRQKRDPSQTASRQHALSDEGNDGAVDREEASQNETEESTQAPPRRGRRNTRVAANTRTDARRSSLAEKSASIDPSSSDHSEDRDVHSAEVDTDASAPPSRTRRRISGATSKTAKSTTDEVEQAEKPTSTRRRARKSEESSKQAGEQQETASSPKPARRGRPRKQAHPPAEEAPAVKPIIIDEDSPTPTKKVGWWKR